jgi:hypothetical protein
MSEHAERLVTVNLPRRLGWPLSKGYAFTNAPSKKKGDLTKAILACDRREKKQVAGPLKESWPWQKRQKLMVIRRHRALWR